MRLRPSTSETSTPHIDLSDEIPDDRAELRIAAPNRGWVSSMGNAVIFVGRARSYADQLHIDVDTLVHILRDEGVSADYMQTLAVMVHEHSDVASRLIHPKVGGWHKENEGVHLESTADQEHVTFSNALHVIAGQSLHGLNNTVLHEAGHLQADAMGSDWQPLYTPDRVRRLRRFGLCALATAIALGGIAGYESTQPGNLADTITTISGLTACASGVTGGMAAALPLPILWLYSPEERYANKFAARLQKTYALVSSEPSTPSTHLIAEREQVSYLLPLANDVGLTKKPLQSSETVLL